MPDLFTTEERQLLKDQPYEAAKKISPEETRWLDPEWSKRMETYLKDLEHWADQTYWELPLRELQACMIAREVGPVDPKKDYDNLFFQPESGNYPATFWGLEGDDRLRILNEQDPSLPSGGWTSYNAIALYRAPQTTQAILVFDGYGMKADWPGANFSWIRSPLNLAIFDYCDSATGGYCVYQIYAPEPSSQKLAKYPLFREGPLNSSLKTISMVQAEDSIESPQFFKRGRLLPQFKDRDQTHRWNGKQFVNQDNVRFEKFLPLCRQALKEKFSTVKEKFDPSDGKSWSNLKECDPSNYPLKCPLSNDISYLYFQQNNREEAQRYAEKALSACQGYDKESKAAEYNYLRAIGRQ